MNQGPNWHGDGTLRPVWGEIDRAAIASNVALVRRWLPPEVQLTASVKANAYGHGVVEVVRILERSGVGQVMTASPADAHAIRASGSGVRIVMLAACLPDALPRYVADGLIPTVYSWAAAEALSRQATRPTEVYVKVDAGLGRLGINLDEAASFVKRVAGLPRLIVGGVYTHLPFATARGESWARARVRKFGALMRELRVSGLDVPYRQAVSSSGVVAGHASDELSAACVGSLLYGLPPMPALPVNRQGLVPALSSVRARVIGVFEHPRSRRAGSGGRKRYGAGSATCVVPVGLQDGYRAGSRNRTLHALVGGSRARVVGVSLAHTVLELSGAPVDVGDEVVLVGQQGDEAISLEELARARNETTLEVLMSLSGRIPYIYRVGTSEKVERFGFAPSASRGY
jgi:alanine racemase